ncbi:type II toxin-antitoxin system Phd/YefM family antitoxin [Corynebacterium sp. zg-331]|uniref:type II toxin-antitoxin system Phd/YefM family antitoxin n=1 Tax=unclassified Corynebacterium TaxID=2624378 RepID=UPI00128DD749|nr:MULTISPECIES: type II toxin-antitoxin system Phd/YefM family antitoxin [unclassified Corynebacterium]MBC3185951.1 type II toxin-antitoxin system Phd/YefM family antitoxin [Corynebacterium sp. zg-331]MPV52442.1 type II toxin-antitoxin system prevent-host-death family antitoxin [Corynebacterium sp. zg331]
MASTTSTAARANLYRLIDKVNEHSDPLLITGQRHNAVLVGEEDWRAIQETLYLTSIPGMVESLREAEAEGVQGGSTELEW